MRKPVITARQAVEHIANGATVTLGGVSGGGVPESILREMETAFLQTGAPRELFVVHAGGLGDHASRGVIHLAHEGLMARVMTGHYGLQEPVAQLALENKVEAYDLPQGVISQLFRAIAAHRPGVVTQVGLGTFLDPRFGDRGKMNARTTEEYASLLTIEGTEWMLYKSFPIQVALLRGTTADEEGNITLEHETSFWDLLSQAEAVHNSGGIVIVEVKRLAQAGTLDPRQVKIPGFLVDYLVVDDHPTMNWKTRFDASYVGEIKKPEGAIEPIPLDLRKIIARRAAMELHAGDVANIGAGIADKVPSVITEEGYVDQVVFTEEPGIIGGTGGFGLDFGSATNPTAIIDQAYMFDFYDGGGLDMAFLSFVECDPAGNVNVSKLSNRIEGPGGFINITSAARQINFMGTFTAHGLQARLHDGHLRILREGCYRKFCQHVSHLTLNAKQARAKGQRILYITERAVFEMVSDGIELKEIAPGIDLKKDILEQIPFSLKIAADLKEMDPRIFREAPMGMTIQPKEAKR